MAISLAPVSLKPAHLKRYRDIARLLLKYGRREWRDTGWAADAGLSEAELVADGSTPAAQQLAADLEALGPTFIKLGQVLAARADLLPLPYLTALARLQDQVEPFAFAEVERVVETELGVRLAKAFAHFESVPLAAASLGQVHRAALRDGRPVAVKVQRPGVRETMVDDLAAIGEAAAWLENHTEVGGRYQLAALAEEFRHTLQRELDYGREAQSLERMGEILEPFRRLVVPQPVHGYTTSRVLTMDYVRGRKITSIGPLARLELDGEGLADELFDAYLHQVLVAGFFHADPHPGNVFLTEDRRLALLDLGMVGHLSSALQERLLRLLLAASDGRGEEAAALAEAMGSRLPHFDAGSFTNAIASLVAQQREHTLEQLAIGRLMLAVARASADAGLRLPTELPLLGKTLLQLDEIGRAIAPGFQPNRAIRRHALEIVREHLRKSASPPNLLAALGDVKEFLERLPARTNKILDLVANNELKLQVDAIDERLLMEGAQKIANRISVGLVLAALIVGASMLMQVPTQFRILGYPGLAMLLFLAAAAGGVGLVASILWNDRRARRSRRG